MLTKGVASAVPCEIDYSEPYSTPWAISPESVLPVGPSVCIFFNHDRGRLTDGSSPGGYFVKRKQIEETKSFVKTPEGERYPEGSPRI